MTRLLHDLNHEEMIISNLISNYDFRNEVILLIQKDFFKGMFKLVFNIIYDFHINEYKNFGLKEIFLKIKDNKNVENDLLEEIGKKFVDMEKKGYNLDMDFLLEETNKWISEKSIEKGVLDCINIMENSPENSHEMPEILVNALNVSMKKDNGLNFMTDVEERFKKYRIKEDKNPFSSELNILNHATDGGLNKKSLNIFMAGTGIGKTLTLCSLASDYIKSGKNVLYVTLEISEERIASRIDANLLDITIGDLYTKSIEELTFKFEQFKMNGKRGSLFIKEYPTSSINTIHLKGLIKDLKMKHSFIPDIIMVDYLNLMNPARNLGKNSNSYSSVKCVAEELRGLACETNTTLLSVTQTNREGIGGDEVNLDSVSESAGLPATADFFCGIFQNEHQRNANIYMFKILKNRYSDKVNFRFSLGVNFSKMRIFELADEEQEAIENQGLNTISSGPAKKETNGILTDFKPVNRPRRNKH